MTSSQQLIHWMRFDVSFQGVFSLDTMPAMPRLKTYGFIVNTQTQNLPGQHWIAVRVFHDQAWIFDPLAFPPVAEIGQHLLDRCQIRVIHTPEVSIQPLNTVSCGQHCIYFLYTLSHASNEREVHEFINKMCS